MNSTENQLSPSQTMAEVMALRVVAPQHYLLSLKAPRIAKDSQPGQFIHVLSRDSASCDPLLRRAFSIMATRDEQIDILFRVGGKGTANLSKVHPGDCLDILGPLGRPFDTTLFHVKHTGEPAPRPILVGGGVGVPPLVFLGKSLNDAGFPPLMIIGARGATEVLAVDDFTKQHIQTLIATEDGSLGHAGRVTEIMEAELKKVMAQESQSPIPPVQIHPRAVVYACGPLPMLRAVAAIAARFEVPCQVSMEENMPCGIGVCNGCVIAMKNKDADSPNKEFGDATHYDRYRRICIAGPAVWASEIDWETN